MKTVTSKLTIGEPSKQKKQKGNENQPLVRGNSSVRGLMLNAATVVALTAMLAVAMPASAASTSSSGNKLQCFSGSTDFPGVYGGTCALVPGGSVFRTAGPGSMDPDPLNPNDAYAGVYIENTNLGGKPVSTVNKLSFSYTAGSGTAASGGSPRISIPIDVDANESWDLFAFIDTLGCNNGNPETGTLDAINDSTCTVALSDNTSYVNWSAFVAANPTYRIASDTVAFVIVDQPGVWTITNVQLGKGPSKGGQ